MGIEFDDDVVNFYDRKSGEILKKGFSDNKFWWIKFELPLTDLSTEKSTNKLNRVSLRQEGVVTSEIKKR